MACEEATLFITLCGFLLVTMATEPRAWANNSQSETAVSLRDLAPGHDSEQTISSIMRSVVIESLWNSET